MLWCEDSWCTDLARRVFFDGCDRVERHNCNHERSVRDTPGNHMVVGTARVVTEVQVARVRLGIVEAIHTAMHVEVDTFGAVVVEQQDSELRQHLNNRFVRRSSRDQLDVESIHRVTHLYDVKGRVCTKNSLSTIPGNCLWWSCICVLVCVLVLTEGRDPGRGVLQLQDRPVDEFGAVDLRVLRRTDGGRRLDVLPNLVEGLKR